MTATARKPVNLSLDATLLEKAKALDVNISRAAEQGLRQAVKLANEAQWLRENAEAIESSNRYFEEHGLPLARYRQF